MSRSKPIAIVLVNDHRLQREGLALMIHAQPGFQVLPAAANVEEVLAQVRARQPEIVLLDLGHMDEDCLTLAAAIRGEVPDARIIVMGIDAGHHRVESLLHSGVAGFLAKHASFDDFIWTVRIVASGGQVLPEPRRSAFDTPFESSVNFGDEPSALPRTRESVRLTNREREVIDLLAEGLSNKAIAARLNIALHTVKSHVHNVLEKLSLNSRLEVAAFSHSLRSTQS